MLFIKSLGRLGPSRVATTRRADKRLNISTKYLISSSSESKSTPQTDQQGQLIDIKDSCLNRLKQILDKPEEEYLRIQVETGGCSGFSYLFDIETNARLNTEEDLIFERDNHRVVVSKDILPYMKGSAIEYTESLIKNSFQIINPVAETKCSCGTSFSIDLNKLQKSSQPEGKQQ